MISRRVLGGSGSGKTVLALNIGEQLLQQGIPALLVSKGDLSRLRQNFSGYSGSGHEATERR